MPPAGPGGPQQPQGQPYPQQPQGQPYPQQPQGPAYPQQGQPYPQGQFGGGPVPGTGPMPPNMAQGNAPGGPQPFPQAPVGKPKKGRRILASVGSVVGVIVVYIIIRVVLSVGVGTAVSSADDAHNTNVGDCASVTGTTSKPKYDKVDCGAGTANYQVGVVLKPTDTCPKGYDEYYEEGTLNNVKLCLAAVLTDGKCYDFDTTGATEMGYKDIPCTDPKATQVKTMKGATDSKGCPDPDRALVYAPLKIVYCAVAPSGS
jgi:hypothetical protein